MISLGQWRKFVTNVSDNSELELLRLEVIDLFEEETHAIWSAKTDRVEVIRPDTQRLTTLFLKLRPVSSITKVETREGSGDWVELTADTDYQNEDYELERIGGCWNVDKVRVTYSGGYADDFPPKDITAALIVQGKFMAARYKTQNVALAGQNFRGGSGQFLQADLHPLFKRVAKKYRRIA